MNNCLLKYHHCIHGVFGSYVRILDARRQCFLVWCNLFLEQDFSQIHPELPTEITLVYV